MVAIRILMTLVVVLVSIPVHAANNNSRISSEPTGAIAFSTTTVDFGTIKRGQKLMAKFPFTNSGLGPLVIQGVQAPCDCTTVEAFNGKTYAPGEAGTLNVTFDSTDYNGHVAKALTVVTNERAMPDRTLSISATVNSDLEANPPLVDFGEVFVNQTPEQQVIVKNNMKSDLKIERLSFNDDLLEVSLSKESKDWLIHVKLKPTVPIGFLNETIFVKNNSQALPEMPVPVRATIKGQISLTPSYIEFGSVAEREKSNRQMNLSGLEAFDVTSNRVELNINGTKSEDSDKVLKINVLPADKNGKKVSLELTNPGNKTGSVHGKVYFETTNPQQKNLAVDFYAFFR